MYVHNKPFLAGGYIQTLQAGQDDTILAAGKVNYTEAKAYCPITVHRAESKVKIGDQPHQGQNNGVGPLHLYQVAHKPGKIHFELPYMRELLIASQ
jgi:hypothetical protein